MKKRILYGQLIFLWGSTLLALPLIPDTIPAHYGASGMVDRWGSKYESLLLPIISLIMAAVLLVAINAAMKKEHNNYANANIALLSGNGCLFVFNLLNLYFLYTSLAQVENLNSLSLDLNQLLFSGLGLLLIILGNILPKARRNHFIGIRTPWSLKNSMTWRKTQWFGAITMIISGILFIFISLFVTGWLCLFLNLGILLIMVLLDTLYSYLIAKKYAS